MNDLNIPRRVNLNEFTPAEKAIYEAVGVVEAAGAHPLLTDAVILLQEAREKVADYVDLMNPPGSSGNIEEVAKTAEEFLILLAEQGGAMISSNECTEEEIELARKENRMWVNGDGLGFVWDPLNRGDYQNGEQ